MIDATALRLALFTDTYPPQVNGVSRTLERLVHAVEERGGVARVFTVSDPEARSDTRVVRFPSVPFWAYKQLRLSWPGQSAVRGALREFTPTVVHAATEFGVGLSGLRAARAHGTPFVSSYHTNFTAYAQYYRLGLFASPGWQYFRWFHNRGLRTYCPTRAIARDLEGRGFGNVRVWSRGIDTVRFNPSYRSADLRREIGASDDTLLVMYVGRLAAEKGLGLALDVMQRVASDLQGRVQFGLVGDGPFEEEVRARAPHGTWLPGTLSGDALSAAYASADLFFFPSTTDTFGNVLLEAMASGLPVLGADVGPTRELVGETRGWLVSPDDVDGFVATIARLVADREAVAGARGSALEFARASTWERVWDELIADYLVLHRGAFG